MLVDYHIHTPWCNHAKGRPEEFADKAIELGIYELGFSEHSPWMLQETVKLAPTFEELETFFSAINKLKANFNNSGKLKIRLGMEMDYLPDRMALAQHYASRPELDYVIGAVHHIGKWGYDQIAQVDMFNLLGVNQAYKDYFSLLIEMINTRLFDIVGHIDLIKIFGYRPEGGYRDLMLKAAEAIARTNMVVEVNTSGFDRPAGEPYPGLEFLKILKAHNIAVTLGSDAHDLKQLARHFDKAIGLLKSIGYTHLATFEKRISHLIPL